METNENNIEDLPSSKLGTKEYWDSIYERELTNFEDHGDEGEIWFGTGCERRVLEWIKAKVDTSKRVVDLGCGNGHFLVKLIEAGYTNMTGLDYSEKAVEFADKLVRNFCQDEHDLTNLQVFQADMLNTSLLAADRTGFDLLVDKGTFDAISLKPEEDKVGQVEERTTWTKSLATEFKATMSRLFGNSDLKYFIITSCNWTAEELKFIFAPELEAIGEVPHAKFTFGGKTGQDVSTVIFKWKTL